MANDNTYIKDLSEEDIKKLAKEARFSEWFNKKMEESPIRRKCIQDLLQNWIDCIDAGLVGKGIDLTDARISLQAEQEIKSQLHTPGVRVLQVQSKVGPIPGRGLIFMVDSNIYAHINVGDRVRPEMEEKIYTVVSIETSSPREKSIGLCVSTK